jgi:hypothetical protein
MATTSRSTAATTAPRFEPRMNRAIAADVLYEVSLSGRGVAGALGYARVCKNLDMMYGVSPDVGKASVKKQLNGSGR